MTDRRRYDWQALNVDADWCRLVAYDRGADTSTTQPRDHGDGQDVTHKAAHRPIIAAPSTPARKGPA